MRKGNGNNKLPQNKEISWRKRSDHKFGRSMLRNVPISSHQNTPKGSNKLSTLIISLFISIQKNGLTTNEMDGFMWKHSKVAMTLTPLHKTRCCSPFWTGMAIMLCLGDKWRRNEAKWHGWILSTKLMTFTCNLFTEEISFSSLWIKLNEPYITSKFVTILHVRVYVCLELVRDNPIIASCSHSFMNHQANLRTKFLADLFINITYSSRKLFFGERSVMSWSARGNGFVIWILKNNAKLSFRDDFVWINQRCNVFCWTKGSDVGKIVVAIFEMGCEFDCVCVHGTVRSVPVFPHIFPFLEPISLRVNFLVFMLYF